MRENLKKKKEFKTSMKNRKSPVSLIQISEFLHSFINGTKTDHYRAFLALCPQEVLGEEDPFVE